MSKYKTPIKLAINLAIIIFAAELLIMLILVEVKITSEIIESLIDSTFLLIIIFPGIYFLMYRPMRKNLKQQEELIEKLENANKVIRNHNVELEEKVEEKTIELKRIINQQNAINSLLNLALQKISVEELAIRALEIFIEPDCIGNLPGTVLFIFDNSSQKNKYINYHLKENYTIDVEKIYNSEDSLSELNFQLESKNLKYKVYTSDIVSRYYSFHYVIFDDTEILPMLNEFAQAYSQMLGHVLQRVSLQQSIQEERDRLSVLLDNVLTAVITIDSGGIITSFNKHAETIFGYSSDEVIGENVKLIVPEPHKKNHDDYLKNYLKTGIKKIIGHEKREISAIRKDGTEFPIELSVNEYFVEGERYFVASISDISKRKEDERELHLRQIAINSAANSIVITDTEGTIVYVNHAFERFTGYSKDEAIGQNPRILKSGKHSQEFYEELWNTILRGEIWTGRMINKRKNGELYTEEMTITPVRNKQDEIINFIAVKQDKTLEVEREKRIANYTKLLEKQKSELEQLAEELRESNLQKDKFFSIIAHDLKSPFSALLGYTQILVEEFDELSNEEIKSFTESVSRVTRNIYQLILDLLDWARLQTGRMEIMKTEFNLYVVVAETVGILKPVAEEKDIHLSYSGEKDSSVFADENMIKTVIRNLISNAIKFTNPGGEIKISTLPKGNMIQVCVEDNGVGMTEEEVSKLFKLDTHHTTKGTANEKGTGLGLLLCKEMIEKNDGEIWVNSIKGKGSKFYFTIPMSE